MRIKKMIHMYLAILSCYGVSAQARIGKNDIELKSFERKTVSFLQNEMNQSRIPGVVVGLVKKDEVIFNIGLGKSNIEENKDVDASKTVFRIGSISKLITSLALMQLVDYGMIDINKPVNHYFNNPLFKDRFQEPVLVKHLLSHSSGFDQLGYTRKTNNHEKRPNLEDFLSHNLKQVRKPGQFGVYDTYGITLAGKLIEEVTGRTYKEHMEKHFFPSVGMHNSYVESKLHGDPHLAIGYGLVDEKLVPQPYEWYITTPASSIDATAQDMCNLMVSIINNGKNSSGRAFTDRIGTQIKSRQLAFLRKGVSSFSYGFWEGYHNELRTIEHGGIVFGYESKLFLIPEMDIGFFIAYNRDPETGPATDLAKKYTDFFLEFFVDEKLENIKEPISYPDTQDYAGTYINNLGCFSCPAGNGWSLQSVTVEAGEKGYLKFRGGTFFAMDTLLFQYEKSHNRLQFFKEPDGTIAGLVYRNYSYLKVNEKTIHYILGKGWKKNQRTRLQQLLEDNKLFLNNNKYGGTEDLKFTLVKNSAISIERASTGGITWVDFDNDGDDDAFVTNGYDVSKSNAEPQTNWLYENRKGVFVRLENQLSKHQGFSSGSAWADFDNDGNIDVFVANQKNQDNFLFKNMGHGHFELLKGTPPSSDGGISFTSTWGDIDNDGFVDLFVSNGGFSGKAKNFLYQNMGGAAFEPIQDVVSKDSLQSGGATFVDYDLDGDIDLFVPGNEIRMYENTGNGTFAIDKNSQFVKDPYFNGICMSGTWGDYDNDGDFDLLLIYTNGEKNRLYRNDGKYSFKQVYVGDLTSDQSSAFHALWIDINNDTYLDVIIPNWGTKAQVYLNDSNSNFERYAIEAFENQNIYASMVASSDYDNDGDLDLIIGNWPNSPGDGEENLLFKNESKSGNFINIRLKGNTSNSSAIGAKILVYLKDKDGTLKKMIREVRSQDGFRSQSSLNTMIGLGDYNHTNNVRVFWPSGEVSEHGKIHAGTTNTFTEP